MRCPTICDLSILVLWSLQGDGRVKSLAHAVVDSAPLADFYFREIRFGGSTLFFGGNMSNHVAFRLDHVPEPPDTLSEGGRQEWRSLAPTLHVLGTARPADLRLFELLCELLSDIRSMEETLRAQGHTTRAGSGGEKANPLLASLQAARRHAHSLLQQFGLSPKLNGRRPERFHAHRAEQLYE